MKRVVKFSVALMLACACMLVAGIVHVDNFDQTRGVSVGTDSSYCSWEIGPHGGLSCETAP